MDGCLSHPEQNIPLLKANWDNASTHQLKRVTVNSDGDTIVLARSVDEALKHCEIRRAFNTALHTPSAVASAVSTFREKLHVDLSFSDYAIALRPMDGFPVAF